jgi:hypothetical protein
MSTIKKEPKNSKDYPPFAAGLKVIRQARSHLMVCFLTFPLYVWGVMQLLENRQDITWLMLAYMALYAGFGINASVKRCPRCHGQFFVKKYFLSPFRRSCAHCGLSFDHIHGDPV